MNVVELFAGIGSQRKALTKLEIDYNVLSIAEWYIPAILAYDSIHYGKRNVEENINVNIEEIKKYLKKFTFSMDGKTPLTDKAFFYMNENLMRNLYIANKRTNNLVSIDKVKGYELPNQIDVLTYSFPCQDLSNVGAFHGYRSGIDKDKKSRSGLLWQVERIIKERFNLGLNLPKILLMENVSTLLSPRHNKNFQTWIDSLEDLGYYSKYYTLNSKDFGIPQNRERIFMISVYTKDLDQVTKNNCINEINQEFVGKKEMKPLKSFLKTNYQGKYKVEAEEAQPNDTASRREIYENNYYLFGNEKRRLMKYCRTITTRQDRHPNSGVIDYNGEKNTFRFLTAREVFLLMGFSEEDYESIENGNFYRNKTSLFFSRDKYYVLAGNSIVVDVLEVVFKRIHKIYEIMNNRR
ncbi:MAG: DNA (cytosine-5-)-methyltransferase [Candidatus Izemoplasmatales bacterium]